MVLLFCAALSCSFTSYAWYFPGFFEFIDGNFFFFFFFYINLIVIFFFFYNKCFIILFFFFFLFVFFFLLLFSESLILYALFLFLTNRNYFSELVRWILLSHIWFLFNTCILSCHQQVYVAYVVAMRYPLVFRP